MPRGVARTPAAWEWVKTRPCLECGEVKPWALYSPRAYFPDGTVRWIKSVCRACEVSDALGRQRRWREANREHVRAYQRAWSQRRREALETERHHDTMLPTAPLRSFLERAYAERAEVDSTYTLARFAEECGVSERMIRRIDREQERTAMRVVDTICTRLGVPMWEVYPELLEEAA